METEHEELEEATIEDELANLDAVLSGLSQAPADVDSPAAAAEEAAVAAAEDMLLDLDDMHVAERVATLSGAMAKAGIADVLEGAEMLVGSEDPAVQSAIVGLVTDDDLADSMDIAAISGQLFAVSELMAAANMPVLADFLEVKGEELHDIAVDTILRYSAVRALAEAGAGGEAESAVVDEQEPADFSAPMADAPVEAEPSADLAAVDEAAEDMAQPPDAMPEEPGPETHS